VPGSGARVADVTLPSKVNVTSPMIWASASLAPADAPSTPKPSKSARLRDLEDEISRQAGGADQSIYRAAQPPRRR